MINFRIMLDISNIYNEIKHLNLKKYNSPFPTLFVTAKDPDDACYKVISELIRLLILQDKSDNMKAICHKIKKLCKIDKIYILN